MTQLNKTFIVKLSEEQMNKLEEVSKKYGMKKSEVLRAALNFQLDYLLERRKDR